MIAANELRINNWYNCANPMEGGKLYPSQFTIWTEYFDFEAYGEPIPLTPEILEKCGFKCIDSTFYTINNLISFAVFDGKLSTTYVCKDNEINQVKHLHQLQNLYYALTGEELIFNQ